MFPEVMQLTEVKPFIKCVDYWPGHIQPDRLEIYRQISLPQERMLKEHGYRIHLFRAPYGASSPKVNTIARYLGCEVIKWGQTSKDASEEWKGDRIIKLLLKETEPGDIILCHNGAKELHKYLVPVLKEFIARGYTFCTVSEMMGWTWDDTFTARETMDLSVWQN